MAGKHGRDMSDAGILETGVGFECKQTSKFKT